MQHVVPADVHVRLDNLTRRFREGEREHAVLAGLTVDVRAGEAIALRGRSGSGKSTLLNLVCGIDAPDAGDVIIAGRHLNRLSERERTLFRRRHIGFVYQAFNLVPTLNVGDNVNLVLELNGESRAGSVRRTQELLDAVGLAERVESFPESLSGGEQQRVAIARALAHRPRLLLADEPTGNLDDETASGVLQLMHTLRRDHGATLILATHSSAVAASCERVLELRGGRLVNA